jgi:hypothetical protein
MCLQNVILVNEAPVGRLLAGAGRGASKLAGPRKTAFENTP